MSRWWDRYGFRSIIVILALIVAFWVKQTQAAFLSEVYYFIVEPFGVQDQLVLEDRLTNARILELEQRVGQLQQQNRQLKQLLDYCGDSNRGNYSCTYSWQKSRSLVAAGNFG